MNKIYTLGILVFLTSCGGIPPEWDGRWQGVDEGINDDIVMVIKKYSSGTKRRVILDGDTCYFNNAEESEVIIKCDFLGDESFEPLAAGTLTIEGDTIIFSSKNASAAFQFTVNFIRI